ncbi:MAG TPA: DNA polymerase III subunit delta [Chloroflexi bacterium]|nr:DNA polymerase III subunit delta [Chloroflexota bacterium]
MGKPTPTFYVFHGTDEFTQAETLSDFKRKLGPPDTVDLNTTYLDGKRITLGELRHACDAIPFLAEKRLVIVTGLLAHLSPRRGQQLSQSQHEYLDALTDYLPTLPPTTRLVLVESLALPAQHPILQLARETKRGYVKQFDPPRDRELPQWIVSRVQRHGGEIELRAAHQLAAAIDADLRLLDQEIQKLVTYTNAERPISTADVDTLVPYTQAAVVFDMVDALGRRDGRTAAQTLHRLLDDGEHPMGLLAMIVRQFRLLIQVKELKTEGASSREIAQALKLHPFPTSKLYNQVTHFTAAQLEMVYRHLMDTDVAIKTGEIEPEVALDLLVAGLAATE